MKVRNKRSSKVLQKFLPLLVIVSMIVALLPGSAGTVSAETGSESVITDYLPTIYETIDANGFKHPGVGLTKELLENLQTQVRAQKEPWKTYFDQLVASVDPWGKPLATRTVSSRFSEGCFCSQNYNERFIWDGLTAYTQALMYVITGDEVYRANTMYIIRKWEQKNPVDYAYFVDSHIHTGVPLYRMVTAAEIMRYTSTQTPELEWTDQDTANLTNNVIVPVTDTFNHTNHRFMNQHLYPLIGAISGYIFTGNVERYHEAVEWFTVNKTAVDQHVNGSIKRLFRLVDTNAATGEKVDNPQVQITEMGRDQAHSTGDVINVAIVSRLLQAQGTKVDPVDGTVSTAENAVTTYDFLDKRILAGTDHFARYMNGYDTPWIPTEARMREDGSPVIYQVLNTAYQGRIGGNAYDLYYYYKYEQGLDIEQVAPYFAEMFKKRTDYHWASRDSGGEYWLYIPKEAEAEGATNLPKVDPNPNWKEIEVRFTNLDGNSTAMQEGDVSFVRIKAAESGSKIALVQSNSGTRVLGYKIRTNGAAKLEAFGETITLPDTQGQWRYVYYNLPKDSELRTMNYFTIIGNGTTVDIDHINVNAANELTPPVFNEGNTALNLFAYVGSEATLHYDFSATDAGLSDVVTYRIAGAPEGAVFDTSTGAFAWKPTQAGTYAFGVEASDGTTVSTRDVTVTVANDRQSAVDAVNAPYDTNTDYIWATHDTYKLTNDDTMSVIDTATDAEFYQKLAALYDAVQGLQLTTPLHTDGSINYLNMFLSSGFNPKRFLDSETSTSGNTAINLGVHMDMGPNFRVSASKFQIQARAGFPERGGGIAMYGSNDKEIWTRLTPEVTPVSADLHTLTVSPELQNEQFRFLKIQMINKPYDAPWPELSEFRIFGKRHEVINKISSVSIGSDQAFGGRIVLGDTAKLSFQSTEAIQNVKVTLQGVPATVHSEDGLNWTAEAVMVPGTAPGTVLFKLNYQTMEGIDAPETLFVTDGSRLILVDESDVISDVTSITEVTDSYGRSPADAIAVANRLFDNNPGTVTDYRLNGSGAGAWVQFDFGQGGYAQLSYVELLARQDGYYTRIGGTVIQGSNDNATWKTLSTGAVSTRDWQFLSISDNTPYRYIRITNGNNWFGNMSEVRFHGDLVYNAEYFDSNVLAPDGYTKGSYYLYMKEVARIKAAMSEPGADTSGLAAEFDQAKNLLVPYTISLYSFEGDANNTFGSNGGTVIGSPAYSAGKIGQAIELNGTNSYVTLPQAHPLSAAEAITITAWVNWGGGNMWQRIFDFGNSTSQYLLLTPSSRDDKKLRFKIKNGSSELELETQQLPVGDWAHVAVTLGSGTAKLYVNGELKAESNNLTIKPSDFKPRNNYIGKSNNSADPLFNGKIDEFRIENSVLSADEIKVIYNKTSTWFDNSLLTLLLEEAAAIDTELYQEESVQVLQADVSHAESVYALADTTQEEIDAASEGLIAALEGLQWKDITASLDPVEPSGKNGWYTSPVTVTLSPEPIAEYSQDGGITWTAYSAPVVLSEEGTHQLLYRRSVDTGETESLELHIDLTAPVVQITGETSYTVDQTVMITCSASDVTSSVYGKPCDQPLLQVKAYMLESGENTAEVTAEDMAGHQTTATHTFRVTVTFDSLKTVTNSFLQETGYKAWETVAISYNQKLDQAKAAAGNGKIDAAKSMIADYIAQVTDQTGKYFTQEQADILIRWAQIVI
ncbi:LamG-like jellyroll fold domain-containing protein [Paenibacillus sp. Soil522]|uniref:LamG-like jellyroll fold domain-containing protein n=1 Tax=Paenibacillus sp. Soil522 TaxID=1736388 RepID=UPI0006FB092D|nr:LamG-like jellyroll fold domain-containing protein [Paenibacillus sp. Soil522]KRE35227.1 hypothetical protein ASG81_21840 [Paenibacillus sp. Soil522]